jgi:hypothetical protein
VFRSECHHAGLDGLIVSLQSRIELFEADKHAQQTLPAIWLQFGDVGSLIPEKFDDHSLVIFRPKRILN